MPLDPRVILSATPPAQAMPSFDPTQAMGNVYRLQNAQQVQQLNQLRLAEAQQEQQERGTMARAFQSHVRTDPATGLTTVDVPQAFGQALRTSQNPLGILKAQSEYAKGLADLKTADLEARAKQLDGAMNGLKIGGQVAAGIEGRIAAGMDPQRSWELGIAEMARAGLPTAQIPTFYDAQSLAGWKDQAVSREEQLKAEREAVNQQLREREVRVKEEEVPLTRARAARERKELAALERVQELEPGAAGAKTMSEADVQDAMTQTGRSRQEVVKAAHAAGYRTPGATAATPPTPATAPPTPAATPPTPATAPPTPTAAPPTPAVPPPTPTAAPPTPAVPPPTPAVAPPAAGAPPAAAPATQAAPPAPASPRLQADEQRLRRLEELRDQHEAHIEQLRPYSTSEAGSKRLQQAERELDRRNTEIERLRTRIYEQGPEKQARQLELERAKPLAEEQGQRAAREQMSLQEFYKGSDEALRVVDTTTGKPISPASNFLTTETKQRAGEAKLLSKDEYAQYQSIRTAVPILRKIQGYYDSIYGEGGVFAGLTAQDWGRVSTMTWKEAAERYPVLAAADKYIRTNAEALARGIRGMKGPATEGDIERMLEAFGGLRGGLEFSAWPPKLAYYTPSSRAVALRAMDDQVETLNAVTGVVLDNPAFEHEGLHRYFRPEQQETAPSAVQRPSTGTPQAVPSRPLGQGFGRGVMPR